MTKLRPATVDDVEELFDVRCSVSENHQSRDQLADIGVTPGSVKEMIAGGDYITTIAEVDGRAAGFTMAQISRGYIFACFVRPEEEGQGIGRMLMRAAEDGLRAAGLRRAWLSTGADPQLRAAGFYLHLGWVEDDVLEDGQLRFSKNFLDDDAAEAPGAVRPARSRPGFDHDLPLI